MATLRDRLSDAIIASFDHEATNSPQWTVPKKGAQGNLSTN